jgi:SAM-dependent methyltransferase
VSASRIAAANREEARRWNEEMGPLWVEHQERIDALLEPLGSLALAEANAQLGASVLDVGCGAGTTSLALARRVGPGGRVLGLDVSAPLVALARERAVRAGLTQLEIVEGDAQQQELPAQSFDLLFSRFGVMFFADPTAAFRNLVRALRPGARLTFVCWQAPERNPWVALPLAAVARVLTLPAPPPPDVPGPFAFADRARVSRLLAAAGFADVEARSVELDLAFGSDIDSALILALQAGPASRVVREAGDAGRRAAEPVLRELLARHLGPHGVTFGSAAWLFTARRVP